MNLDPVDPRQKIIADAIEQLDAPMALVEASAQDASFNILYSNEAMTMTTELRRTTCWANPSPTLRPGRPSS